MLMVAVMLAVAVLALGGVCIAGYLVAAHRARAAADLAALSGAVAVSNGSDGCRAAGRIARENGAALSDCSRVGDDLDFVLTVQARVRVRAFVPGLPAIVHASAHAGTGR